ncbi:MAG: translation elongation factor Ts [Rickettsiaceae bacterium H1]|nr:translation elongation factor Ts [Rickettsiaceae bacterium H1]
MSVNISDIKKLRDETLAGMMHCKQALEKSQGDFNQAKEYLKLKGLSIANKKSLRETLDGLLTAVIEEDSDGAYGFVMELNSETDFVARSDKFQKLFKNIVEVALKSRVRSIEDLKSKKIFNGTVEEEITNHIAILGENLRLSNFAVSGIKQGVISSYVHGEISPGLGKIAALVTLESSSTNKDKLKDLGKKVAMHIVASKPIAISIEQLPSEIIDKEKALIEEQVSTINKPKEVIEKIVNGKMNKYYSEVVLLKQQFVMDNTMTISDLLENYSKGLEAEIKLTDYKLIVLGNNG